jgi:hypothetical protein
VCETIALTVTAVLLQAATACGETVDEPARTIPDTALERAAPQPSTAAPAVDTGSPAAACIRGGTPREEVRRIMGEPDSVSFGSWLYGPSELMFGYGVVVEIRNEGGNVTVC